MILIECYKVTIVVKWLNLAFSRQFNIVPEQLVLNSNTFSLISDQPNKIQSLKMELGLADLFRHNAKTSIGHVVFDESPSRIASGIATSNDHKPTKTTQFQTSSIFTSNSNSNSKYVNK